MILVVGGRASGKKTYVEGLGYTPDQMSCDPAAACPVLLGAQELVRDEAVDAEALAYELASKEVVVCDEVGSGIVPAEASERAWRDEAGKLAVLVAKQADCVVRMVCGIPVVLKGELPLSSGLSYE